MAPAAVVIAAGVAAALHVGKLPPAVGALREALGLTLVEAGFLLSLVQLAGMLLGVALGAAAEGLGLRRSVVLGLGVLALASAAGGLAPSAAALMALRALEGLGFLLVVLPAPALLRRLVPAGGLSRTLGVWGAYMPLATALALLVGPLAVEAIGWRGWWWALGAVSAAMAVAVRLGVPAPEPAATGLLHDRAGTAWPQRLRRTLASPGPWAVATAFAAYSGQWLAVIGFLPTIAAQAGLSAAATGLLGAGAAAVNIVGNVAGGRLLHRGVAPAGLLAAGFAVMAVAAAAAFADGPWGGTPAALRYAAVLAFSMGGGLIPATLFSLAVRLAPGEGAIATTVGWMQQWSSLGQLGGPPLVAWVASRTGGWGSTWLVTGACSLAGLLLTGLVARLLARTR